MTKESPTKTEEQKSSAMEKKPALFVEIEESLNMRNPSIQNGVRYLKVKPKT